MARIALLDSPLRLALLVVAAMMVLAPAARAGLVADDFSYSGALLGKTGGTGWTGAWGVSTGTGGNTSRVLADASANLTSPLYDIVQSGTGFAYGDYNAFRGINRWIEPDLSGTVWFSALMRNTNAVYHSGIQFNNHADGTFTGSDYNRGPWDIELSGTSLIARYNSVNSASLATLALNETHLILGRLTVGPGNDTMEVWADPADLANLGSPLFTANSANMGDDLFLGGVFAYGNVNNNTSLREGMVDALRISDGNGDPNLAFEDVTGREIPEPLTLLLMSLSSAAAERYVRRRRAA